MPLIQEDYSFGNGAANWGYESFIQIFFSGSNLNPPYSNIKIYTRVTSSNGNIINDYPGQLIYEYVNDVATVYSSSYFSNGSLDLQGTYSPNWPC